jgi:hypothetical protein
MGNDLVTPDDAFRARRSVDNMPSQPRPRIVAFLLGVVGLLTVPVSLVHSQESPFAGRPGLAEAEREPASLATCENLQSALADFRQPRSRVDLWVTGPLTLVHTDGVLWYLAVCSSPGVSVMCVTYSDNDMKLGDRVTLRGAFNQQDERHIVLDPCLASRS